MNIDFEALVKKHEGKETAQLIRDVLKDYHNQMVVSLKKEIIEAAKKEVFSSINKGLQTGGWR